MLSCIPGQTFSFGQPRSCDINIETKKFNKKFDFLIKTIWLSNQNNLLTLKMRFNCSSAVPPGNIGLPVAISKNIHPTPLEQKHH